MLNAQSNGTVEFGGGYSISNRDDKSANHHTPNSEVTLPLAPPVLDPNQTSFRSDNAQPNAESLLRSAAHTRDNSMSTVISPRDLNGVDNQYTRVLKVKEADQSDVTLD